MTVLSKQKLIKKMNDTANWCIKNALKRNYWEDEVTIASDIPVEKEYVKAVVKIIKVKVDKITQIQW